MALILEDRAAKPPPPVVQKLEERLIRKIVGLKLVESVQLGRYPL